MSDPSSPDRSVQEPKSKPTFIQRAWRIFKRLLLAGLVLTAVLLVAGYFYEKAALRRVAREFPAPGELVDVGGRRLHFDVQGEGEPTVVLEAGLAGGSLDWSLVTPEVAKFTRVVSYDRAGLFWSDPGAASTQGRQVVEDLTAGLTEMGIEGPYIFVGHSLGGLYGQMFYYLHPNEVAGVLLVDSAHEDDFEHFPELVEVLAQADRTVAILGQLARFGVPRVLIQLSGGHPLLPELQLLPESALSSWMALAPRQSQHQATNNEFAIHAAICGQLKDAAIPWDDTPLSVLSGAKYAVNLGANFAEVRQQLHKELADRSSNGTQRIVEDSGHYIHIERPDVVIEEIRRLVDEVRDSSRSDLMDNSSM